MSAEGCNENVVNERAFMDRYFSLPNYNRMNDKCLIFCPKNHGSISPTQKYQIMQFYSKLHTVCQNKF